MSPRVRGALGALGAAGLLAAGGCSGGDGTAAADDAATPPDTAEVVRTDLVEETEYDATLGRLAGDAVTAAREGTVTSAPEPGTTLGNGSVLYTVDGEPVVGLLGDTPAYRALTAYPEPVSVAAPLDGVITWLPEVGTEISNGSVIMRIDGEPVIALVGDVPAYRDLRDLPENMTGDDVLQLERMLAEAGLAEAHDVTVDTEFTTQTANALEALQEYIGAAEDEALNVGEFVVLDAPTTVIDVPVDVGDRAGAGADPVLTLADGDRLTGPDVAQLNTALAELGYLDAEVLAGQAADEFSAATDAALRAFQESVGMEADGALDLGELVFLSAPIRVAEVKAPAGTVINPGSEVLGVTGEEIVVSFDLPAEDQGSLATGDAATVELPDGTVVDGTVSAVATVASVADNAPVFPVEIALDDAALAFVAGLDEAPVDVAFVSESAEGVTAVPVAALVALREGGYAVEVVAAGGTTRLVGVEAGFFADGLVEVTGDVAPGDSVVVP
jgi:peptidoglycan hydrolase-like protein with peptidoglycan-binding domain